MSKRSIPRVLVLLSTYNGRQYLETQLNSLAGQTGVALSVLVRDDGSKDDTLEILERFREKLDITVMAARNVGPTRSFLSLLQSCPEDFEYYAFCDQDDFWEPDKLETAVQNLTRHQGCPALYYSGQTLVDRDMQFLYEHLLDNQRNVPANCIFNQMAGCTAVFNREVLRIMRSIKSKSAPGCHDSCLYRACALSAGMTIMCDSKGHIQYRQHGSNVVGLDYSWKGKLRKVIRYMKPSELLQDLAYLLPGGEWEQNNRCHTLLTKVAEANHSLGSKWWLLTHQSWLNFHSIPLRAIYIYKILFSQF